MGNTSIYDRGGWLGLSKIEMLISCYKRNDFKLRTAYFAWTEPMLCLPESSCPHLYGNLMSTPIKFYDSDLQVCSGHVQQLRHEDSWELLFFLGS